MNRCPVAARRRTLREVFASLDAGRGWRMHTASAYTAHALYVNGDVIAHVVGNPEGWWWGLQQDPRRVGPLTLAGGPREACLAARRAVRSEIGKRGAMRS